MVGNCFWKAIVSSDQNSTFGFTKSCMIWTKYLFLTVFTHKKFVSSLVLPKFQVHSKFIFNFEISEFFFKNPFKKIQDFIVEFIQPT